MKWWQIHGAKMLMLTCPMEHISIKLKGSQRHSNLGVRNRLDTLKPNSI